MSISLSPTEFLTGGLSMLQRPIDSVNRGSKTGGNGDFIPTPTNQSPYISKDIDVNCDLPLASTGTKTYNIGGLSMLQRPIDSVDRGSKTGDNGDFILAPTNPSPYISKDINMNRNFPLSSSGTKMHNIGPDLQPQSKEDDTQTEVCSEESSAVGSYEKLTIASFKELKAGSSDGNSKGIFERNERKTAVYLEKLKGDNLRRHTTTSPCIIKICTERKLPRVPFSPGANTSDPLQSLEGIHKGKENAVNNESLNEKARAKTVKRSGRKREKLSEENIKDVKMAAQLNPTMKQKKEYLSLEQRVELKLAFHTNERPDASTIHEISAKVNLPPLKVRRWFTNRRCLTRRSKKDNKCSSAVDTKLNPEKLRSSPTATVLESRSLENVEDPMCIPASEHTSASLHKQTLPLPAQIQLSLNTSSQSTPARTPAPTTHDMKTDCTYIQQEAEVEDNRNENKLLNLDSHLTDDTVYNSDRLSLIAADLDSSRELLPCNTDSQCTPGMTPSGLMYDVFMGNPCVPNEKQPLSNIIETELPTMEDMDILSALEDIDDLGSFLELPPFNTSSQCTNRLTQSVPWNVFMGNPYFPNEQPLSNTVENGLPTMDDMDGVPILGDFDALFGLPPVEHVGTTREVLADIIRSTLLSSPPHDCD